MSRFKTELCNNLIELGNCKYGDRCHYAHGAHELRQVSRRHPKYRTEKCKNFELTGKCPFGPRCSYVHPKPDLDSMIEQLSKYMKHTRAPKPDSEDDAENINYFTRTNTSRSTSIATSTTTDEENKENQRIIEYQNSRNNLLNNHQLVDHHHHNNHPHQQQHPIHFNHKYPLAINDNAILQNRNHSSLSTANATPFSKIISSNANVSSQAITNSSSSLVTRTPLGSSNRSNNISTPNNITNHNLQANDHHHHHNHQMNSQSLANNGTCSNNLSIFETTSFENSNKKLRLIDQDSSENPNSTSASNPFAISNPLSDIFNGTNTNGRSPLTLNKQFLTRF